MSIKNQIEGYKMNLNNLHKLCAYNIYKTDSPCQLCLRAKHPVIMGEGDINSELMIIGMCPGASEDEANKIFIGRAGKKLNEILADCQIKRNEVYITNAIKCFMPPGEKPTLKQIKACSNILLEEIKLSKAKKIIALGEVAFFGLQYAFLGKKVKKFNRGEVSKFYVGDREIEVLSTYHPAYILRSPHAYNIVVSDIIKFFKKQIPINYKVISSLEGIKEFTEFLSNYTEPIVVDLETKGLSYDDNEIICIGIATSKNQAYIIPISYYDSVLDKLVYHFSEVETMEILSLVENAFLKSKIIGHNLKFDRTILKNFYNIEIAENIYFDTMVAHHLIREVKPHDLKTLILMHTSFGNYFDEMKTAMDNKNVDWWKVTKKENIWTYCSYDCCSNYELYEVLKDKLKEENLDNLFKISMQHYKVIMLEMEAIGLPFSRSYVENLSNELKIESGKLEKELNELAKREINWNSPKQVIEVFLQNGIKLTEKTPKGNYSINVEVLKKLANEYEMASKVLQMRKLTKMSGTYISILEKHGDKKDLSSGKDIVRVRCNISITGTETGRLSTFSPSLHTIPRENRYRNMVQAEYGYEIMQGDYSMAELKVMAAYAKCKSMLDAFEQGFDLHRFTASNIFNIPLEKVTSEQRTVAKTTNFGIIYLISPYGLAKRLNIPNELAESYINKWFETYPEIKTFIKKVSAAYENKNVGEYLVLKNIFGRRRRLPRVDKYIYEGKQKKYNPQFEHIKREAVNFFPQSTVGDALSTATVRFYNKKKHLGDKCRILLSIHDALLNEVHSSVLEESLYILKNAMEFRLPFKNIDLTLTADISHNKVWVKE